MFHKMWVLFRQSPYSKEFAGHYHKDRQLDSKRHMGEFREVQASLNLCMELHGRRDGGYCLRA